MRQILSVLFFFLFAGVAQADVRELKSCPVQYSEDGSQAYEFTTLNTCDSKAVVRIHDFALGISCIIVSTIVGECVKEDDLSSDALKNYSNIKKAAPKNDSYIPCLLVSREQGIHQEMGRLNASEKGCERARLIRRIDIKMRRACPVYTNIPLSCAVLPEDHPFLKR